MTRDRHGRYIFYCIFKKHLLSFVPSAENKQIKKEGVGCSPSLFLTAHDDFSELRLPHLGTRMGIHKLYA